MADVLFKQGTKSKYSSITPDTYTFYKVQDSSSEDPDVYLGTIKLSNQVDIDNLLAQLDELENRVENLEKGIVDKALNECTYDEILKNVQAGVAEDIWSIGDTTNLITLNGDLGDYLTFESYKCKAILIGFDHNMDLETEGKHNITLQFGQNENGVNIAFIDSYYNSNALGYNALNMNYVENTNVGGWESCHMRNDICPQFLELLPSDLQGIIKETTKYTDNIGNASGNVESNVTATKDKIFLLSYHEVGFASTNANSYEANYTEPYSEMYSSSSNRIKYRHSAPASTCIWWDRSPYQSGSIYFCAVSTNGNGNSYNARYSYGFAPAFQIY